MPGWPDLAFSMASAAKNRMVSIHLFSSSLLSDISSPYGIEDILFKTKIKLLHEK
jgi:hypothetical protein